MTLSRLKTHQRLLLQEFRGGFRLLNILNQMVWCRTPVFLDMKQQRQAPCPRETKKTMPFWFSLSDPKKKWSGASIWMTRPQDPQDQGESVGPRIKLDESWMSWMPDPIRSHDSRRTGVLCHISVTRIYGYLNCFAFVCFASRHVRHPFPDLWHPFHNDLGRGSSSGNAVGTFSKGTKFWYLRMLSHVLSIFYPLMCDPTLRDISMRASYLCTFLTLSDPLLLGYPGTCPFYTDSELQSCPRIKEWWFCAWGPWGLGALEFR